MDCKSLPLEQRQHQQQERREEEEEGTKERWLYVSPILYKKSNFVSNGEPMFPTRESASPFHTTIMMDPFHSISRPPFNRSNYFHLFKRYRDSKTPPQSPWIQQQQQQQQQQEEEEEKVLTDFKRDTKNIVPIFISTFKPNGIKLSWSAPCFQNNVGWLIRHKSNEKTTFTFIFESSNATSLFCSDWYLLATRETFHIKAVAWRGNHTLTISNLLQSDIDAILNFGICLFVFEDGLLGTIVDAYIAGRILYDVYFEEDKIRFLKDNMADFPFDERPFINTPIMNTTWIGNGDLIGVVTLSGLDVILMYGTGSHIGHVATTLWIPNENNNDLLELFVVESLDGGIRRTAWNQWIEQHSSTGQIVIFGKLKKQYQKRLNHKKAVEFFLKSENLPYGYQNIAYAWIDTLSGNYPTPLDEHMIPTALTIFGQLSSNWLNILFLQGLNMRFQKVFGLNITCTDMTCVCKTADALNLTVQQLLTIPERDDWLYPPMGSRAMVCSVFIMSMFKEADMFNDLNITASEFTPKDLYMLDIWDKNWTRPPECLQNGDNYPYCQMMGPWYWPLPDYAQFASVTPYDHMNERCEAKPPNYVRHPNKC